MRALPSPASASELPEAFQLLHPENKLLVSIPFPWGLAAQASPGCGDVKTELRALGFPASGNPSPTPKRECRVSRSRHPGFPGLPRTRPFGPSRAHCACALLPHSLRARRRIPFPAYKSLYAPVAPARLTPAAQIIWEGGRHRYFPPSGFLSPAPELLNPSKKPSDDSERPFCCSAQIGHTKNRARVPAIKHVKVREQL